MTFIKKSWIPADITLSVHGGSFDLTTKKPKDHVNHPDVIKGIGTGGAHYP